MSWIEMSAMVPLLEHNDNNLHHRNDKLHDCCRHHNISLQSNLDFHRILWLLQNIFISFAIIFHHRNNFEKIALNFSEYKPWLTRNFVKALANFAYWCYDRWQTTITSIKLTVIVIEIIMAHSISNFRHISKTTSQ